SLSWAFEADETSTREESAATPVNRLNGSSRTDAVEPALAIDLASGSVVIFLELSLLNECHKWSGAGFALLGEATRGTGEEMLLQEGFAISASWALGNRGVRDAITRALAIAQKLGDVGASLRLRAGLHIFLMRIGDLRESLPVAQEFARISRSMTDPSY